jgi:hypothetical protein
MSHPDGHPRIGQDDAPLANDIAAAIERHRGTVPLSRRYQAAAAALAVLEGQRLAPVIYDPHSTTMQTTAADVAETFAAAERSSDEPAAAPNAPSEFAPHLDEPATDPADVAHVAALDAVCGGADLAEFIVALVAGVAVDPDRDPEDFPLMRRTGSWEAAILEQILESSGARHIPDAYQRPRRPLLHELSLYDIVRWLAPRVRELYCDTLALRTEVLADEIDAAWREQLHRLGDDEATS